MQIRIGYDIAVSVTAPTAMVLMLNIRPELESNLTRSEKLQLSPEIPVKEYIDGFGNRCVRLVAPPGLLTLKADGEITDSGETDEIAEDAIQHPIEDLPSNVLEFLLGSRYCEVDRLSSFAWETFGNTAPGWARVQAVNDWVHNHITFGYKYARSTKTAYDALQEATGVCRDYQHLAVTFCRALGIPARYGTGYLGDIRVPASSGPMDFSAWYEVFLGGRWYAFDGRHNTPRVGRTLMAVGRDAADVALITSFGPHTLEKFEVITEEITGA